MPKAKLDNAYCLAATCKPGSRNTFHWDTIIPGFVLEVRPSGGKTYALRYTDGGGTQRQQKIGRFDTITNEQARKAARTFRAEVDLGGNPQAEKREKKAVPPYSELADQHLTFAKGYQKRPENTERVLNTHILPRWGKVRLDEIKTQDVAKWLAEKRASGLAPATVEKIRITFNRSFELAMKWQLHGVTANPVRHVPRPKYDNARERYLTPAEAKRLKAAVAKSSNPQLPNIVGLLLLTGARKSELLHAKWEHVDLERRSWHIPTSKTGKARHVPLSQAAIDIITDLPKWEGCPWLLPHPISLQPLTNIKRAWDEARKAAKLPDLRIHDLRHSAASFMINAGIDLYAVGRILGHADHQSTQRYSHLANDTLMRAVEAGAAGWSD